MAAQLALSHSHFPARRTQKEEMLSGRHFYPFDKELCLRLHPAPYRSIRFRIGEQ